MPPPTPAPIPVADLTDPRLADYINIKERQLRPEFTPGQDRREDPLAPHGKFIAEGVVVFGHLVRSAYRTLSVLTTPARLAAIGDDLARLPAQTPVYVISQAEMDGLAGFPIHRGLLAVGARLPPADALALVTPARPGDIVQVLEDVSNHDNIGSILRNAAAFGARAVLLNHGCADPLYRKAIRVSVGCALRVPIGRLGGWPAGLADLRGRGYRIAALTPDPAAIALEVFAATTSHQRQPTVLLLGAEGPGLSAEALSLADVRVRVPVASWVDSLNVSTAAAIALYQLARYTKPMRKPDET